MQREQLNREPSYNAPQNLPSGAEVAAAKALYPDGNWAPVSPTNGNFPLSGSNAQGGKTNVAEELRGPPIYESRKSRPTTANSQANGQPIERLLAQQQQERLLEYEYKQDGQNRVHVKPAPIGTAVTTTTTTTGNAVTSTTTTRTNPNRRSKDVSSHGHAQNEDQRVGGLEDFPDPLKVTKSRTSLSSEAARASLDRPHRVSGQLVHKPDVPDLRKSIDSDIGYGVAIPPRTSSAQHGQETGHMRSSSLQKPLPEPHVQEHISNARTAPQQEYNSNQSHNPDPFRACENGIHDSSTPIDLSGIVDLRNTEDVDYHTTYAPAVTHETVTVTHHEDVQEIITRETHNHHIFHRILPVIDFEILPPRHFIETRLGGKYEISPDIVPPGTNEAIQTTIQDAVAKLMPRSTSHTPAFPNRFSARSFHGRDGDLKEWTGPYGEPRTEQWWVHPPTWATGGRETGQTEPFHLGSEFEEDDGLRTPLPDDTSKWPQQLRRASLAQPQRPQSKRMSNSARMSSEYQDYQIYADATEAPPVPVHQQGRSAGGKTVLPIRMQHDGGRF